MTQNVVYRMVWFGRACATSIIFRMFMFMHTVCLRHFANWHIYKLVLIDLISQATVVTGI